MKWGWIPGRMVENQLAAVLIDVVDPESGDHTLPIENGGRLEGPGRANSAG